MAWDFSTDPDFERQLEWMRTFVREEVWPIEAVEDRLTQSELDRINAPLQAEVKARGLWAAHLPPDLGGQGFGQVKLGLMNEILGTSIYAPPVFGCQAPDSGNSEILALAGSAEQKQRWLAPLLAGELRSAFSMTEPGTPGSDPTQLVSRAVRDGDGYVLDGHKWFTSNGSIADFLIVMAVTDPDAPPHRRASMFIVPVDAPGVTIVRDVPTMEHPQPRFGVLGGHSEILYEGVRLGADALLGGEGEGFLIAQQRLVPGRIHHCMRWLGMARRAYDAMCERALYRPVKHGLLRDTQTVQAWIADSAAEMQAARLMTLHAAWRIDRHGSSAARTDVSMIKFFGAKVLHDVVDRVGADPRCARLLGRHAARDALPLRSPCALRRRCGRGAPRDGGSSCAARLQRAGGRRPQRAPSDAARSRLAQVRGRARAGGGGVVRDPARWYASPEMNSTQGRGTGRGRNTKREKILAAATERFGTVGYEHTRWADIASDVGVGPTALYHYFESKQHCVYEIMDEALDDFRARFVAITTSERDAGPGPGGGARELLRALRAGGPPQPRTGGRAGSALGAQLFANARSTLARRRGLAHVTWSSPGRASSPRRCAKARSTAPIPRLLTRALLGLYNSVWHWYRPNGMVALTRVAEVFTQLALTMVGLPPRALEPERAAA